MRFVDRPDAAIRCGKKGPIGCYTPFPQPRLLHVSLDYLYQHGYRDSPQLSNYLMHEVTTTCRLHAGRPGQANNPQRALVLTLFRHVMRNLPLLPSYLRSIPPPPPPHLDLGCKVAELQLQCFADLAPLLILAELCPASRKFIGEFEVLAVGSPGSWKGWWVRCGVS